MRRLTTSSCKTDTQAPKSTKAMMLFPPSVTLIVGLPGAPLAASTCFPHAAVLLGRGVAGTYARSHRSDTCGQRHHMRNIRADHRGSRQVDGRVVPAAVKGCDGSSNHFEFDQLCHEPFLTSQNLRNYFVKWR